MIRPCVQSPICNLIRSLLISSSPSAEERISNGGFDSGDDWTLDASWSIGSGVLTHSAAAKDNAIQVFAAPLVGGESFQLSFDCTDIGSGNTYRVVLFDGVDLVQVLFSDALTLGTTTVSGTVSAAADRIYVSAFQSGGTQVVLDNVSLVA